MGHPTRIGGRIGDAMRTRRAGFILRLLAAIGIVLSMGQPVAAHAHAADAQFVMCASGVNADCSKTGDAQGPIGHCWTAASCQFSAPLESGPVIAEMLARGCFAISAPDIHLGRKLRPDLQPPRLSIQA